jgi:hypothetical protein
VTLIVIVRPAAVELVEPVGVVVVPVVVVATAVDGVEAAG